jgi:hypothetical protein
MALTNYLLRPDAAVRRVAVARKVAAAIKEEVVLVAAQIRVEEMPADMFRLLTEMRAVGSVVVVRFTRRQ